MDLAQHIIPALVTGSVGLFTYLVHSYFEKIREADIELKQEISKLEGKLDLMMKEIRDNTIESASMRSEVKALWRFVDNSHQRASDNRRAS